MITNYCYWLHRHPLLPPPTPMDDLIYSILFLCLFCCCLVVIVLVFDVTFISLFRFLVAIVYFTSFLYFDVKKWFAFALKKSIFVNLENKTTIIKKSTKVQTLGTI